VTQLEAGPRSKEGLKEELLRFLIVGGGALVTDFSVYFGALWLVADISPSAAKVASFIAGATWSFVMNRKYVFRSTAAFHRQIVPFALLYLVSLGLNTGVNAFALDQGLPKLLAWFFATGTSTVSNFLGMKLVVFRNKPG
jgi:putative flippase GtrA